jgi:hypothetical protein
MRRTALAILLGSTALASAAALAQPADQPRPPAAAAGPGAECDRLVAALERDARPNPPVTLEQARALQRAGDQQACGDAIRRAAAEPAPAPGAPAAAPAGQATAPEGGGQGNRVVVEQPAPAVRVEQAAPQVTVQQAEPQVTVRQRQPEILVRQPAPTVTVDIPQPEIIVRMPPPEVSVAQAQPQVQVVQPEPQVQVVQPEQPQVQIQPAEPRVNLQQAGDAQPNVRVEGEPQPQVRYERAEPRVVVNQAQGQPQVRVEEMQGQPPGQQPAPEGVAAIAPPAEPAPAAGTAPPAEQAQPAPGRTAAVAPAEPATGAGAGAGTESWYATMSGQELVEETLYGADGVQIGEIENVVVGPDGRTASAVVGVGGVLGLGERRIAIPLDQIQRGPDERLTTTLTREQIRAMRAYEAGAYRRLDPNRRLGDLGAPG